MNKNDILHHYKGGTYTVLYVAKDKSSHPISQNSIVYTDGKEVYVRPESEMNELVDVNGVLLPRFIVD